ncbi:MAG: hypothetical protein HY436_01575, partial [Candidatus Liptonbacteria bacterium]|nr:hypothetical protein [Candidatus Liptonbacteria bacterium]
GRPAVATATSYAQYLLTEKMGVLVGFRNPGAITRALDELLADEKRRARMGMEAYEATRKMTWPNVAAAYYKLYQKFADIGAEEKKLPDVKFDHVMRLTDSFGMVHHARYAKPERRFGYSLDDNARALVVAAGHYRETRKPELLALVQKYLDFLKFAQKRNGGFARIVNAQRERDLVHDEDVTGRGVWALGYLLSQEFPSALMRRQAEGMFSRALPLAARLEAPRAIAFAMTGLYYYLQYAPRARIFRVFTKLADRQLAFYRASASDDWQWFEDRLTYSNSKLPESLYYAYALTRDRRYLDVAERTLKILSAITFEKKYY